MKENRTHGPLIAAVAGKNMRDNYNQSHAIGTPDGKWLIAGLFSDVPGGEVAAKAYAEFFAHAANCHDDLLAALERLVNAKATASVRELVAGWNGENRPDGPYKERHPSRLGATIRTDCGAVYDLDAALTEARAAINKARGE